MLDCPEKKRVCHVGKFVPHDLLRFDNICCHTRNRALVADRSRQDDVNVMADAGMHDTACENLFLNRGCDSTAFPNGVDSAHVILVPAAGKCLFRVHAQRGAEQCALNVVSCKCIPGEKALDITKLDEAL